jgi:hypothetical protein
MYIDDDDKEASTEQGILEDIGEGNEPASGEDVSTEVPREAQDDTQTTPATSGEQGTEASVDGEPQQQQARGPEDLKDAQGNVIAQGGRERRFYEVAHREKARAEGLSRELETSKAQIDAINKAGNVGTQFGLTPDEVTTGAQLMQAWKKDPANTVQYMLTQAQSLGHNMENVAGGGVNMEAVQQMLNTTLAPLLGERQERVDTQQARDEAVKQYNAFNTQYPDAAIHDNSLSQIIKQDPSLSLDAAYFKLRSFFSERGLDFSKSLEALQQEYVAAKGNGANNTQPQPPDGGSVNPNDATNTARVADVNETFDDIIKGAIKSAGIT